MFNHYARMLADIPRWSIVPVIKRQHVAEHSYYVSLYVAELLGHSYYRGWPADRKFAAIRYALIHDIAEARMSDIPGPIKRAIRDDEKMAYLEERITDEMGYIDQHDYRWHVDDGIKALVKVADLIDELFYLHTEQAIGNQRLSRVIENVTYRLERAASTTGMPYDEWVDVRYQIDQAIGAINDGLETWSNDTDLPSEPTDIPF